jgi:hypothetical protein
MFWVLLASGNRLLQEEAREQYSCPAAAGSRHPGLDCSPIRTHPGTESKRIVRIYPGCRRAPCLPDPVWEGSVPRGVTMSLGPVFRRLGRRCQPGPAGSPPAGAGAGVWARTPGTAKTTGRTLKTRFTRLFSSAQTPKVIAFQLARARREQEVAGILLQRTYPHLRAGFVGLVHFDSTDTPLVKPLII